MLFVFCVTAGMLFQSYVMKRIPAATPKISVSYSEFRSMLDETVKSLSIEDDRKYILDENYLDEKSVSKYIQTVCETTADNITPENIKDLLWDIFIPVNKDGVISLIEKDNKTLVLECENIDKMNVLDYELMGTSNNEIMSASNGFYISQNREAYKNMPYGTSTVKKSGCGSAALAMAINYANNAEIVSFEDVIAWANENNIYVDHEGSRWSLIRTFPKTVLTNCREIYIDNVPDFENALSDGSVLVTSMKKGHFTERGHFIVITKCENGIVSVLDSVSICRSLNKWASQTIVNESNKYFWKITKQGGKL